MTQQADPDAGASVSDGPRLDDPGLDNPAWHSLVGRHRPLSEGTERVRRFRPDVSIFGGVRDWSDPGVWDDIVSLVGPGGALVFTGNDPEPPPGWSVTASTGVQLVETSALVPVVDPEVVRLSEADVPEMLAFAERTKPGPFLPGTHLLGTYLGIRREGRLVAMAGERLQPDGWTEISAVCTDAELRGRGLATRLVLSVAAGIQARGERALLHALATNEGAIRLYEALGFVLRRHTNFGLVRAPETSGDDTR